MMTSNNIPCVFPVTYKDLANIKSTNYINEKARHTMFAVESGCMQLMIEKEGTPRMHCGRQEASLAPATPTEALLEHWQRCV